VYFLAKRELFRPVFGWVLREVNALPVRRGAVDRKALQMCLDTIERGEGLVVFPEGTRVKRGEMLPPKPGVGRIAVKAGCPIVIGFVWGSDRISDVIVGREPMGIRYGPGFTRDEVLAYSDSKDGWQELAEEVMRRIKSLRDQVLAELKPHQAQPDK
jgi:1-acyl-sn-glycerol-3-phosphate acyltransferase